MKIIRKGLNAEDGIHITCKYCGCEYVIEDRNDLEAKEVVDTEHRRYIEYLHRCPECHNAGSFGVDSYLYKESPFIGSSIVFSRKDWKERFEVKCSEQ